VVFSLPEGELTWALGEVVEVSEEGEHLDFTMEVAEGEQLEVRAGPGCERRGDGALSVGDLVEVLGRRQEIFEEHTGGMRQAPEHRSVLALTALARGEDPWTAMEQVLVGLGFDPGPRLDPEQEPLPWPAGIIVHPSAERAGPPRLRLQVRPPPLDLLPFSLLLPVVFFLYFGWNFWAAARLYIGVAVPVVVALTMFLMSLRHRVITVGEGWLRVQLGHLPWPRRRVAALEEIQAVLVCADHDAPGVKVRTHGGDDDRWLLPAQRDPVRSVVVARLLEQVLGIRPRPELLPDEVRPELDGELPDLHAALRPPQAPGDPASELGPRNHMKVAAFKHPTPDGAEATRRGGVLSISLNDSGVSVRLIYMFGVGLLWLGFNRHQLQSSLLAPLHLAAVVAVLWPLYGFAAGLLNRTTIMVSETALSMTRGPLPWPGRLRCSREDIRGLETDSDMVGKGSSVYHLDMELRGGRRARLINGSGSEERVWWLKTALEQELGLGR